MFFIGIGSRLSKEYFIEMLNSMICKNTMCGDKMKIIKSVKLFINLLFI